MILLPQKLYEGYKSFKENLDFPSSVLYQRLAKEGQNPQTMVIACCDSRVAPENIFDSQPGEIFVARNIANLIPPYGPDDNYHSTSSALEYGVKVLGVKYILVLGHEDCGGIKGSLAKCDDQLCEQQATKTDFIGKWLGLLEPLSQPIRQAQNLENIEKAILLEQASLIQSLDNLRSYPWIEQKLATNELAIGAAWFSIKERELWVYNEKTQKFDKITTNL